MKKNFRFPIAGCILILLSAFCAFLGIKMAFMNTGIIAEIEKNMIILDKPVVLAENEGKLVLIRGKAVQDTEYVTDEIFGVMAKSPKLYRRVEMLQWEKDTQNDETIYVKKWAVNLLPQTSSLNSTYKNPDKMPYETKTTTARVMLGEFVVPDLAISNLLATEDNFEINAEIAKQLGLFLYDSIEGPCLQSDYTIVQNVGDLRIYFTYADPAQLENVTILAMQSGNELTEYVGAKGAKINEFWTKHIADDEVIRHYKGNLALGYILFFVIFIILAVSGIFMIRRRIVEYKKDSV